MTTTPAPPRWVRITLVAAAGTALAAAGAGATFYVLGGRPDLRDVVASTARLIGLEPTEYGARNAAAADDRRNQPQTSGTSAALSAALPAAIRRRIMVQRVSKPRDLDPKLRADLLGLLAYVRDAESADAEQHRYPDHIHHVATSLLAALTEPESNDTDRSFR